jgi:hypothetical protein
VPKSTPPVTKLCTRCGETKPRSDFYKRTASPDGLNLSCRDCALQDKKDLREFYKSRSEEEIEAAAAARGPRICRICKLVKNPDEYPRDRGRKDGRGTLCLDCAAANTRNYNRSLTPEERADLKRRKSAEFQNNRETYRDYQLRKNFGITLKQYRKMLEAQDRLCAICKQPSTLVKLGRVVELSVDHCHSTGKLRKLLCNGCNHGLGHFHDSPVLLRLAALYIEGFLDPPLAS